MSITIDVKSIRNITLISFYIQTYYHLKSCIEHYAQNNDTAFGNAFEYQEKFQISNLLHTSIEYLLT